MKFTIYFNVKKIRCLAYLLLIDQWKVRSVQMYCLLSTSSLSFSGLETAEAVITGTKHIIADIMHKNPDVMEKIRHLYVVLFKFIFWAGLVEGLFSTQGQLE